jgi:hypothetical protein
MEARDPDFPAMGWQGATDKLAGTRGSMLEVRCSRLEVRVGDETKEGSNVGSFLGYPHPGGIQGSVKYPIDSTRLAGVPVRAQEEQGNKGVRGWEGERRIRDEQRR